MKMKSTNAVIKMMGITVIAVIAMLRPAFCQEKGKNICPVGVNCFTVNIVSSSGQQVKMRLPKDIRSGDIITGSVIEEKKSATAVNNKSSSTLEGMVIEIDGKQTKLSHRLFSFIVPAGLASLPFLLKNAAGEVIQSGQVPIGPVLADLLSDLWWNYPLGGLGVKGTKFSTEAVGQPGQSLRISGSFDGNAANTNVSLNGQACEIIAESPRMSFVEIPQNATAGVSQLTIEENNNKESSKVNIVNLNLSANKRSLLKGQKATISVVVSGLEGLELRNNSALKLSLENQSPQTIVFSKEINNVITKEINADSVKDGKYEFSTPIIGLTKGAYAITATITAPKDDNECVKKYQDCMAQIKADKDKAIKKCQDAGGAGVDDCIAQVNTASAKLEKACLDEFLKCRK